MSNHLISICIPTYNGEKYLREALESVKSQTYKNIEVIISDDQSTDTTLEICEVFKGEVDFPVFIHSHIPKGIGANWNHSIEKANGDYIKILFQDDLLDPACIETMMMYLQKNQLDIVISKRKIIDNASQIISTGNWYQKYGDLQSLAKIEMKDFFILKKKMLRQLDYSIYSSENIIGEPCVSLFTKKLYQKTGAFNTKLKQILDYEYWLRVLTNYDIGIIAEKLVSFRYHENQTSTSNYNDNINEAPLIRELLFNKFLFYIDRENAKYYIKQKYPLLKKLISLRYKIFP